MSETTSETDTTPPEVETSGEQEMGDTVVVATDQADVVITIGQSSHHLSPEIARDLQKDLRGAIEEAEKARAKERRNERQQQQRQEEPQGGG
jgi:hypothetical protein